MKNTLISVVIFLAMMLFITYSHNKVITLCNDIISQCESIEKKLDNDNWNDSYESAVKLMNDIEESFIFISVYMNHQDVDCLHNETLKLSQYTRYKNRSESLSSVHIIKHSAKSIQELQTPTLKNIF